MKKAMRFSTARLALFKHMADTHNLTLLDSEMDDIEHLCNAIIQARNADPAMTVFAINCESNQNETHIVTARDAEDAMKQVCQLGPKRIVAVIAGAHPDVRHVTKRR